VDQTPLPYSFDREWFTLAITVTPTAPPKPEENPADENAAPEAESKTAPPAERAASQDEGPEKENESNGGEPAKEEAKPEPPPEPLPPQTFYYTFIVFPPGESLIGSVEDEPERSVQESGELRHVVNLTRPFALLDREVRFEELIAFLPAYGEFMQQFKAQPSDAGFGPHWYDSVSFCRWLGEQMGLSEADQAYASPDSLDTEQYPSEPNPEANRANRNWPLELGRRGFRLPTESEWEVASRAGVRTAYSYGSDVALLDRFAWLQENSGKHVHPPRELRPTVRGVFDLHGNLFEWTHDWYGAFSESAESDSLGAKEGSYRVLRGSSWVSSAANGRSAYRTSYDPMGRTTSNGFRIALRPFSQEQVPAEPIKGAEPSGAGTEGVSAEQRPEMP
jgi:formylglycine-generating enzyme required for sulfatase activity